MKSRMNLLLIVVAVMLVTITWMLARGQKTTVLAAVAPTHTAPERTLEIRVRAMPSPTAPPSTMPATVPPVVANAVVTPEPIEKATYTAVSGDTLSNVAAGLFGSDSKKNRDAVVAANPSLQADPDRVLDGKTYVRVAVPEAVPVAPADVQAAPPATPVAAVAPTGPPAAASDPVLKYTAKPGDNVSVLAAGLLGADSKTNRDAIVGENKSLQDDPDHVVAGKTYKIPAPNGLSAAPASTPAQPLAPTTQPDADDVVQHGANRELRYKARPGDNVSKLAEILLGSDTPENRNAIINNNESLKNDPDHVVIGQTYWIPAPTAPVPQS